MDGGSSGESGAKIPLDRLWVNPDCGLKTRNWPETESTLKNMIQAAKTLRAKYATQAA